MSNEKENSVDALGFYKTRTRNLELKNKEQETELINLQKKVMDFEKKEGENSAAREKDYFLTHKGKEKYWDVFSKVAPEFSKNEKNNQEKIKAQYSELFEMDAKTYDETPKMNDEASNQKDQAVMVNKPAKTLRDFAPDDLTRSWTLNVKKGDIKEK